MAYACPEPPHPIAELKLERFYTDTVGSRSNDVIRNANKARVAPVRQLLRFAADGADANVRYSAAGRIDRRAACALRWITAWAKENALTGPMPTKQGEHHRKWALTGLALAYLKLKSSAPPPQRQVIEPWLQHMADAARALFDNHGIKRNNHWYWLGLGLGAVGIATHSDRHWSKARAIFNDAMTHIDADGSLPMELRRGRRAAHYHVFAATPLVTLAHLAAARGEPWDQRASAPLHRLVELTARGLHDLRVFDRLSGVRQSRKTEAGAGWLPLYRLRYPHAFATADPFVRPAHRWLGGDVRLLAEALARRMPATLVGRRVLIDRCRRLAWCQLRRDERPAK